MITTNFAFEIPMELKEIFLDFLVISIIAQNLDIEILDKDSKEFRLLAYLKQYLSESGNARGQVI